MLLYACIMLRYAYIMLWDACIMLLLQLYTIYPGLGSGWVAYSMMEKDRNLLTHKRNSNNGLRSVVPRWHIGYRRRLTLGHNPMGIIQDRIALCDVLPCRGPGYVSLLRTQPHSCCRGRSVWPCGRILHRPGYVHLLRTQPHSCRSVAVWTHPPPVAHCGHTALYVICRG